MNFWFQDRRIAIPIIFAITMGILFGHLLGNILLSDESVNVIGKTPTKGIYLLQSQAFPEEATALYAQAKMREEGFETIVVKEFNHYYLYHAVSTDPNQFHTIINNFEEKGISYQVKEKMLHRYIEPMKNDPDLIQDVQFYLTTIDYYIQLLDGETVNFSEEYVKNLSKTNIDIFHQLYLLHTIHHSPLSDYYELIVYKTIAEVLM